MIRDLLSALGFGTFYALLLLLFAAWGPFGLDAGPTYTTIAVAGMVGYLGGRWAERDERPHRRHR